MFALVDEWENEVSGRGEFLLVSLEGRNESLTADALACPPVKKARQLPRSRQSAQG